MSYFKPIPGSPFYDWCKENELIINSSFTALEGLRVIKGVDYEFLEQMEKRLDPFFMRCLRELSKVYRKVHRNRIYQFPPPKIMTR